MNRVRVAAVESEKEEAQGKGIAPDAAPPSPSTMEHVNNRIGVRDVAQDTQRDDAGSDGVKEETVGVGEGATVNHLPDAGPRLTKSS